MKKIIVVLVILLVIGGIWFMKNVDYNTKDMGNPDTVDAISGAAPKVSKELIEKPIHNYPELYVGSFNLEELTEYNLPIMIHMGAVWCPPCQKMKPYIEELYEEYMGEILIVYVDVDKVDISDYPLSVVPTQFFFNSDGTPFVPSEEIVMKSPSSWVSFNDKDTNEPLFTTHQGLLTKEELIALFMEMSR